MTLAINVRLLFTGRLGRPDRLLYENVNTPDHDDVPEQSPNRCGLRMAGTMNRKKQNAETLCHRNLLFKWSARSLRYRCSTSFRIVLNNIRSSLLSLLIKSET